MDPKQPSQTLDPKLKQAYDRVMGISLDDTSSQQPISTTQVISPTPSVGTSNDSPGPTTNLTLTPSSQLPQDLTSQINAANPSSAQNPAEPTISPEAPAVSLATNSTTPTQDGSNFTTTTNPIPTLDSTPLPQKSPAVATPIEEVATHPTTFLESTTPLALKTEEKIGVGGFVAEKRKKGLSPMLIIFAGIVLLIAYTLFWVKFFNFPIPFLTQ